MSNADFNIHLWLPRAVAWAEAQRDASLAVGRPLTSAEIAHARDVGVNQPERIRLHVVDRFPRPEDEALRHVADHLGFFSPGMIGLTLGHAVLVDRGHQHEVRLLRHEFRHVYQYEAAGSFVSFLTLYLEQIVEYGYPDAPLEIDARRFEKARNEN